MRERAPAKINLFLHVTGRRDDGYHLLDSLAVFADAADRLSVARCETVRLTVTGPFAAGLGAGDDNLVLRAARALLTAWPADAASRGPGGAHLTLEKHLPVASGIGGGSSDAAAALRLLCRFWSGAAPDAARLADLAAGLGADVPVCLAARPARMQGWGEQLRAAPALPALGLVLVNAGEPVSTQAVFRAHAAQAIGFSPPAALPSGWRDAGDLAASLAGLNNDLEMPARRICPAIDTVLAALGTLPGCRLARMSGSGGTCFALFDNAKAARRAARAGVWQAGWWVWAGGVA